MRAMDTVPPQVGAHALRALADEMSQATFDAGFTYLSLAKMREHVAALRSAADLIENAPHADDCPARIPMHFHKAWPCTCWKAGAL